MKSKTAFRRILSILSAAAMLISLLATVVVLPAAASTAYSANFNLLADFSSTTPTSYTQANGTYSTESQSPSGYGAGLAWSKTEVEDASMTLRMNFSASSSVTTASDTAIAFWVSMKDSGYKYATALRTIVYSRSGLVATDAHSPYKGAPYYLVQDGVCSEHAASNQNITLPGAFEGWVVLPYASLTDHGTVTNNSSVVNADRMTGIELYITNANVNGTVHLDEVGVTTDYEAFVEDMGDFPAEAAYTVTLNGLENATAVEVTGATASVVAAGQSGNAVKVTASAGAKVQIANQLANLSALETFSAVSVWVSTGASAVELVPALTYTTGKAALDATDLTMDFYRLVDAKNGTSEAYAYTGDTVTLPAYFTGYLVMDMVSFAGGKDGSANLSQLVSVDLTVNTAADLTLDTLQASAGANGFITKTLSASLDDDLLMVADATKVSLDNGYFTLLKSGMGSGEFRTAVAVRAGYRLGFRNVKGQQLFGAIADMSEVAVVDVYLGAIRVATYYNADLPLADGGNLAGDVSPDEYNLMVDFDGKQALDTFVYGGGFAELSKADYTYSKLLNWNRGSSSEGISYSDVEIVLPGKGYADEVALVFWMSGEDIASNTNLELTIQAQPTADSKVYSSVYLTEGATYYTLADGATAVTEKAVGVTYRDIGGVALDKNFRGWYIIPLSAFGKYNRGEEAPVVDENGDPVLDDDGEQEMETVWYEADVQPGTVRTVRLHTEANYDNVMHIDQFGMTNDVQAFATSAAANTLEEAPKSYAANTTIYIDFDEKIPFTTDYTAVNCVSPYGAAGVLGNTKNYPLNKAMGAVVGTAADEALVMWVSGKNLSQAVGVTVYPSSLGDKNYCWIPKGGASFTLVSTAGVVSTGALNNGAIPVQAGFEGWMVIPFTSFTPHTGYVGTPDTIVAGTLNYLYFNQTNVILDQIGFTADADALIGTLEGVETSAGHNWENGACSGCGISAFVTGQDFADISGVTVGGAANNESATSVNCITPYGKALSWNRGTSGQAIVRIPVTGGRADDAVLMFYADATGQFATAGYNFYPQINGNNTYPVNGAPYYLVGADGTVTDKAFAGDYKVRVDKDFQGWVIVPIGSVANLSADKITALELRTDTNYNSVVLLDELLFAADLIAAKEYAIAETAKIGKENHTFTGATCTTPGVCSVCGAIGGEPMGTYNAADYQLFLDFDEKAATSVGASDYIQVQNGIGYEGNGLRVYRGQSTDAAVGNGVFNQINFNAIGLDGEALVFYATASSAAGLQLSINATANGKGDLLKPAAGSVFYTVDTAGNLTECAASSGSALSFGAGFEGWVVVPLSSYSVSQWSNTAGLTLDPATINGFYIGCSGAWGTVYELDNFGLTTDADDFIAAAQAGTPASEDSYSHTWVDATCVAPKTCSVCGETEGEPTGEHTYDANGVCTVCGAGVSLDNLYNALVNFDDVQYTKNTPNGTGSQESIPCRTPFGTALKWDRGSTGSQSAFEMDYTATAINTGDALVMWMDGADLNSTFNISVMLYDNGGANGATRCFVVNAGAAYQTVSIDGTVSDLTFTKTDAISVTKGFQGWYVIPLSSFVGNSGWASSVGATLDDGDTLFRIRFAHGNYYNAVLYVDEIGIAGNAASFVAVAAADAADGLEVQHKWSAATCVDPKTCALCGATEGEPDADAHTWVDATCTEPKTCSACGATTGEPGNALSKKVYDLIIDFDAKLPTNISIGESEYIYVGNNGGYSGDALTIYRGQSGVASGGGYFTNIDFGKTDIADGEALVVYVTASSAAGLTFFVNDNNAGARCLKMAAGAEYYTVAADGTKATRSVTTKGALNFDAGFEGWVILPTAAFTLDAWKNDAEITTPMDTATLYTMYVGSAGAWDSLWTIDNFGIAGDIDAFMDTVAAGDVPASETVYGHEYFDACDPVCMICGKVTREASHNVVHVEAVAGTDCQTYDGNVEYWTCVDCGAAWLDEAQTMVTNLMSVKAAGAHQYFDACDPICMVCNEVTREVSHNVVHVSAVAGNCQTIGNVEYWYCDVCGAAWLDEAQTVVTNLMSVKTGYGDHNYVDGSCSICGEADPDAPVDEGTLVSTQKYNNRLTFEVYEMADGSHRLVVSGTGVMPTNKQAASMNFLNYKATIKSVVIEEGVTTVGYGIFNGWTALSSVSLPSTLTTIDGESFRGCTALKAIDIPDSVTTLGYGAFWGAGLESVVIPESVTSIKNYVFYRCKSLVSAEIYGTTEYKVGARIYYAPGARMFSECSKLSNIVLGEKINLLNTYCFHGAALTEFTVPARVKFIYDAAFHSNTKLTKFVMEEGVTYLGWAALFGCSSLTDVTIPETITGGNIATWAFGACTSLESIELPSKLTNLKKRTFSGCTSLKSIELPAAVTTLGDRVFIGCTALESVKLSNITKIDVQTFNNCPKLQSITIPETVTSIGDLAFRLNSSLKTVYIDSATIAAGLTGNAVYGNMIKWAETIAIRSDITNVPSYVTSNYKTVGSVTVDGVEYVTYSK